MTAVARTTDPETSHAAAASVHSITAKQRAVWAVLRGFGPMSDESLVAMYPGLAAIPQSQSGIRTRRNELARMGLAVGAGTGRTRNGRRCQLWKAA